MLCRYSMIEVKRDNQKKKSFLRSEKRKGKRELYDAKYFYLWSVECSVVLVLNLHCFLISLLMTRCVRLLCVLDLLEQKICTSTACVYFEGFTIIPSSAVRPESAIVLEEIAFVL